MGIFPGLESSVTPAPLGARPHPGDTHPGFVHALGLQLPQGGSGRDRHYSVGDKDALPGDPRSRGCLWVKPRAQPARSPEQSHLAKSKLWAPGPDHCLVKAGGRTQSGPADWERNLWKKGKTWASGHPLVHSLQLRVSEVLGPRPGAVSMELDEADRPCPGLVGGVRVGGVYTDEWVFPVVECRQGLSASAPLTCGAGQFCCGGLSWGHWRRSGSAPASTQQRSPQPEMSPTRPAVPWRAKSSPTSPPSRTADAGRRRGRTEPDLG